jgi:mRNA interferase MazF
MATISWNQTPRNVIGLEEGLDATRGRPCMVEFIKGDVAIVTFPFSDLSTTNKRPALVIAALSGDDTILCQITSKAIRDTYAIPLLDSDFHSFRLERA